MRILLIILSLLLLVESGFSQNTIAISDTNFRNALCQDYPSMMDPTCSLLDTLKAETLDATILNLANKNLYDVSEIDKFNRIDSIDVSHNNLTHFLDQIKPNFFWSLLYLDISNNAIELLPTLSTSKQFNTLRYLYFQNNNITELQNYWGFWDTLKVLNISGNLLTDFPDASRAKEAELIDISNNYLTFEDILPQIAHSNFSNVFKVYPQKKIQWSVSDYTVMERNSVTLQLPVDENVTSNVYEWYRNDTLVQTTNMNYLQIDSADLKDAGIYHVLVKNTTPALENVYLETETIILDVYPCLDITAFNYLLTGKCYGGELTLDNNSVFGGTPPYDYYAINGEEDSIGLTDSPQKVLTGTYQIYVKDQVGCVKELVPILTVAPPTSCDENVITPNGDGIQDEIFFEYKGNAIIYNQLGSIIKRLTLPGYWSGSDENGNAIPPGKYIMVIDEKQEVPIKVLW